MQRRTIATYAGIFILLTASCVGLLATTAQPTAPMDNPEYTLEKSQNFSVQGKQFTITDVSATINEEGDLVRSATGRWNQSNGSYSTILANNSTLSYQNSTYRVLVPNTSNPSKATLREVQNLSNSTQTLTQNNETFVVMNSSGGNRTLIPENQYLRQQYGEPNTTQLSTGTSLSYQNNSTTITNISTQGVTLNWTATKVNTVSFGETTPIKTTLIRGGGPIKVSYPAGGTTVSLNNQTYVVSYPDNSTLTLSQNVEQYQSKVEDANRKAERLAGIWGVLILSGLAGFLLLMLGYLPNKG